jgi:hypothetical protein
MEQVFGERVLQTGANILVIVIVAGFFAIAYLVTAGLL